MSDMLNVICCVNFSEHNEEIVNYTKRLTAKETNIFLVHAMPNLHTLRSLSPNAKDFFVNAKEEMQKNLIDFAKNHFGEYNVEAIVYEGNFVENVVKLAEQHCAEMIIMGSNSSSLWPNLGLFHPEYALSGKTHVPLLLVPNALNLECLEHE